jgi:hypothetical protein
MAVAAVVHRLRRVLQPGHRPGAHPVHLRGCEFLRLFPSHIAKFAVSMCDSDEMVCLPPFLSVSLHHSVKILIYICAIQVRRRVLGTVIGGAKIVA